MDLRNFLICLLLSGTTALFSQRHIHNVPEAMVSLQSSDDGALITLSQSGKLYLFNGAEFNLLSDGIKGATAISQQKDQFILLSKSGVLKWSPLSVEQQPLNEECYSYISMDGKEFVLTQTGMYLFKEGRYQLVNDWTNPVSSLAKFYHLEGQYYLSNYNTIYNYKSGSWKVMARDSININDMVNYREGIWVATDSGLRVVKDRMLKQVQIDGLDGKMKVDRLFELEQDLYIQGEGQLLKWNSKDYQMVKIDFKHSPSEVIKDRWGDIWFAEEGNIIQHKFESGNLIGPQNSDITISINGVIQSDDDIIVREEGSDVKIQYGAIHLRQPKSIKFQSLLSPLDTEYQSLTTDRSIVYNDIAAGEYTYRFRSSIDGSQYSYSDPIKISVKAKNEVSVLWWVLGASCMFLLFLALFANYRLQEYKEKSALLTSKLRTANDLVQAQQKTMQLQMNPHFLFNALNSIQGLVALNRNDEAKKYIRTFSRMMRSILDFSTVDKIDLQTEINYIEDYLSIEQMTRSNSFHYKINVDDSLLSDDVKIPPMILQPFLENAILHGVSSIKDGYISVDIIDKETSIHCMIKDNGIGRAAAALKKTATHKSVAIALAKERLQKLSKSNTPDAIQYKDLNPGTQVVIDIPI